MKSLKYLFLFAALVTLGLSSCTKEDITNTNTDDPIDIEVEEGVSNPLVDNISSRSAEGLVLGCFTINYPFSLTINDEEVEITEETDFESLLTGLGEDDFVDFIYPFDITYEDGETTVINSGAELGEAFAVCVPDQGWGFDTLNASGFPAFLVSQDDSCFDLVYPVSLTDLDGNNSTANDESELVGFLSNTSTILFFDFPLSLVDEDGAVYVAESSDELFQLLLSCDFEDGGWDTTFNYGGEIGCYGVDFPFTVVLADGNTAEVNNHDEFCALMIEGDMVGFVYPLTLITFEGETFEVNSEEELNAAIEDCGWGGPGGEEEFSMLLLATGTLIFGSDCYVINYPVSFSVNDETVTVNNDGEYQQLFDTTGGFGEVNFPVSLTYTSGETVTISNIEELAAAVQDCE